MRVLYKEREKGASGQKRTWEKVKRDDNEMFKERKKRGRWKKRTRE